MPISEIAELLDFSGTMVSPIVLEFENRVIKIYKIEELYSVKDEIVLKIEASDDKVRLLMQGVA